MPIDPYDMTDGSSPVSGRSRYPYWLACLSGAFGLGLGTQIHFLVPLRARELGASFEVIGLIIGAGALVSALLSVTSGALIDRLGPRRAFILGTGATTVLSLTFVLPNSYWALLLLQPCLGLARNLGWVASQTYITSLGPVQQRSSLAGRFSFFTNVGQLGGPLMVGGVAQIYGFRWAFLVPAVYAACFTVVGIMLAETRGGRHATTRLSQGTGTRAALELIAIRGIQIALLLSFVRLWINLVYSTFLPVHLVETGFEPALVGTVMATSGFVGALVAPTAGRWTRRWSPQVAALVGLGCGGAALLVVPYVETAPFVYLVPILVGTGGGISLPLLLRIVTAAVPESKHGIALGLRGMVNQTAATAAPLAVGSLIAALGVGVGFLAGGLAAWAVLIAAILLHRVDARQATRAVSRP